MLKKVMIDWKQYITSDNGVLLGKPSFIGTRLSVDFVLARLADGWTDEQLFESYPRLTREHLRAIRFSKLLNTLQARAEENPISLEDITKEVEIVRSFRY